MKYSWAEALIPNSIASTTVDMIVLRFLISDYLSNGKNTKKRSIYVYIYYL